MKLRSYKNVTRFNYRKTPTGLVELGFHEAFHGSDALTRVCVSPSRVANVTYTKGDADREKGTFPFRLTIRESDGAITEIEGTDKYGAAEGTDTQGAYFALIEQQTP